MAESLPQPPGEFLWTPQWLAVLPALRGHDPAPTPVDTKLRLIDPDSNRLKGKSFRGRELLQQLRETHLGAEAAAQTELLTALREHDFDLAYWLKVYRSCDVWEGPQSMGWAVLSCARLAGILPALETWLAHFAGDRLRCRWGGDETAHLALADLLAGLAPASYLQARELAAAWLAREPELLVEIAALFRTEEAWMDAALAVPDIQIHGLDPKRFLLNGLLSVAQAIPLVRYDQLSPERGTRLVLHLVRLHGQGALKLVEDLVRHAIFGSCRVWLAPLLRAFDSTAAMALLIDEVEHVPYRKALEPFARAWPALAIVLASRRPDASARPRLRTWLQALVKASPDALLQAQSQLQPHELEQLHLLLT